MNAPQAPQVQAEPEAVETIEATMGPLTSRAVQSPSMSKKEKAASAFRTISEVADDLRVQQHVLRFWETKFSQIRPLKRGGGRRYYRPEDVEILKTIHRLLYSEGYTIKGVQKLFREKGKNQVMAKALPEAQNSNEAPVNAAPVAAVSAAKTVAGLSSAQREALQGIASELRALRSLIDSSEAA